MLLLELVCSFAWADQRVQDEERVYIGRLVSRLELDADERRQVEAWLATPPQPDSIDPARVPAEHRTRFVRAIESVIAADGEIAAAEREQLLRFVRGFRSG